MAVGSYGIVRPADVSPDDVEILYHYSANRISTTGVTLKKLTMLLLLLMWNTFIRSPFKKNIFLQGFILSCGCDILSA